MSNTKTGPGRWGGGLVRQTPARQATEHSGQEVGLTAGASTLPCECGHPAEDHGQPADTSEPPGECFAFGCPCGRYIDGCVWLNTC